MSSTLVWRHQPFLWFAWILEKLVLTMWTLLKAWVGLFFLLGWEFKGSLSPSFGLNTLWKITCWAPLPMEFSGQENRLPFPIAMDLNPGIEPTSHVSYIGKQILYHYATCETHLCKGLYSSKLTGVERSCSAPPSKGCAWVTIELCQALLQAAALWERDCEGWGLVGSHLDCSLDLHCGHKEFYKMAGGIPCSEATGSRYKGI